MAKVEIKAPIIEEIKSYVDQASAIVLVDYRGLTVEADTVLRKTLREAGSLPGMRSSTGISYSWKTARVPITLS